MLDSETKRRIDAARDILVGKVPDPKSQIEQITIALIYKFMDDMDAEAEELGRKRKFFTGKFAQYGWSKLMSKSVSGHELIELYSASITTMSQNPGVPVLFRDIFKNVYLPYRDPETLKSFLKVIDEFSYSDSEILGDAFEYLLLIMGSQGDAGQFRTPRHIIDFIVDILDPNKNEVILDPACGTAGFLISAYNHIHKKNHSTLTPDDKRRLVKNFRGYDISPDMVRLSLVNLYLHGFNDPHIYEYDTLTSEEKWNEFADVILANPPFMTPKGGIKPHKHFSITASRSEVLFVNYVAEHLTPKGRAGIIVPEGIIFQSQSACKNLRKILVENYLVAVISLPAGVFQPYSWVKTSILILDKELAKQCENIAFFKVENDGFRLGTQRRAIAHGQLGRIGIEIKEYLQTLRNKNRGSNIQPVLGLVVPKEKISASSMNYNLSAERYREESTKASHGSMVPLSALVDIESGSRQKGGAVEAGIPSIGGRQIDKNGNIRFNKMQYISEKHFQKMSKGKLRKNDVLIVKDGTTTGKCAYYSHDIPSAVSEHVFILRAKELIHPHYLYFLIRSNEFQKKLKPFIKGIIGGFGLEFSNITIPVPSLEVQEQILSELEGYQRVINGARAVIDNYKTHMHIDSKWPIFDLSDVTTKITDGAHFTPTYSETGVPFLRVTDITETNTSKKFIPLKEHKELIKRCHPEKGDVLYSKNGTIGIAKLVDWDWDFSIFVSLALLKPKKEVLDSHYLEIFLNSDHAYTQAIARSKSGTVTNLHLGDIKTIKIPVPDLEIQQSIVNKVRDELDLTNSNRRLISCFEEKIKIVLAKLWSGDSVPPMFQNDA